MSGFLYMLSHIKKYLRIHFGFSKSEARATLVLIIIINSLLIIGISIKIIKKNIQPTNISAIEESIIDSKILLFAKNHSKIQEINYKNQARINEKKLITKFNKQTSSSLKKFDINTATIEDLRTIKGIGEILSARIIKFRNKLGGFVSTEQYEEIYGLESEVVKNLQKLTFITKEFCPQQININSATIKELVAHPYINYECSKAIVRYREKNGPYKSLELVSRFFHENNLKFEKASPYFKI